MTDPTEKKSILPDLDRAFSIQIARIRQQLNPFPHSTGSKKPDLEEQEAKLLWVSEGGPDGEPDEQ